MKKFLSVLLTIAMIASMSIVSMAATTLPTSGTITLTEDVTMTSLLELTGDTVINLNGHTITRVSEWDDATGIYAKGFDLTVNGPGKIVAGVPVFSEGVGGTDANVIKLSNVTIEAGYMGVHHNGNYYGADVTIENCIINSEGPSGVYLSSNGNFTNKLTIKESSISGASAVEVKFCDATVINSTLVATGDKNVSDNGGGTCTTGYSFALTNNGGTTSTPSQESKGKIEIIGGNVGETFIKAANGTGAATPTDNTVIKVVEADADESGFGITLVGPYDYDADNHAMVYDAVMEYGDSIFFQMFDQNSGAELSDHDFVKNLKVNAEFIMGGELVESVNVVKKNVKGEYLYYLEFVTADRDITSEADVFVNLEFNRKADKDNKDIIKIKDCKRNVDFTLFYPNTWLNEDEIVDGKTKIKWDTEYALKFNSDDEVELTFGSSENEGTFTVDASGQSKLFLKYTTTADEAIAAANPGVKMHFVNFQGLNGGNVKFNRVGEFVYELEDGVAAYKVVDGKLAEIAGLEVDDGEFTFNTNTLGSFVFADAELVNP